MLVTCTLCGRLFVSAEQLFDSEVRRCKYHPDVARAYGFRLERRRCNELARLEDDGHPGIGDHAE